MNDTAKLIISLVIPQAVGFLSSFFTVASTQEWYPSLIKPVLTPPSWIFAPVWIFLYFLMGIAAYMVWKKGTDMAGVKTAMIFFIIQLVLNFLWSFLFFGFRQPLAAFADIVILLTNVIITTILFYRCEPIAGIILLPYCLWVAFASYLNFFLWYLN